MWAFYWLFLGCLKDDQIALKKKSANPKIEIEKVANGILIVIWVFHIRLLEIV